MSNITRLHSVRLRLDEPELCAWLGQASPGEVLEYPPEHIDRIVEACIDGFQDSMQRQSDAGVVPF